MVLNKRTFFLKNNLMIHNNIRKKIQQILNICHFFLAYVKQMLYFCSVEQIKLVTFNRHNYDTERI